MINEFINVVKILITDTVPNHMGYPHGCSWPETPGEELRDTQTPAFYDLNQLCENILTRLNKTFFLNLEFQTTWVTPTDAAGPRPQVSNAMIHNCRTSLV